MISSQQELKPLFFALVLLSSSSLTGNAEDQIGFISIDCGLRGNFSSYKESTTGINYVSDEKFIDTGKSRSVAQKYIDEYQQPYSSVRSFPEGNRNCYRIEVIKGSKYLIRASFLYGDYDGQGMPPSFDLYLGPNFWDSIEWDDSSTPDEDKEIIYVTRRNYVHICLVSTGKGVPFISGIELRPLDDSVYYTQMGSLKLFGRRSDAGSSDGYRFGTGDDVHDRLWSSMSYDGWRSVNTSRTVESKDPDDHYDVPSIVMSSAATPEDPKANLDIYWTETDNVNTSRYYFFMHFAEIKQLAANELREFNIYYNGVFFHGPISPSYLRRTTVVAQTSLSLLSHNFSISMTKNSTLPPIINAYEIYSIEEFPQLESDQQDVDAVTKLKSTYGLRKNWQGDPCGPKEYSWEGLKCSYNEGPPRVISLNLSSSTLTGEIAPSIANLSMIEDLDLSNNSLTGSIPDFLSQLPNLKILNLEHNQLYGSVPIELVEKRNKGFLFLSVNGNENLCASVSCHKKKTGVVVVATSVAGTCVLLLVVAATCWTLRRKTPRGVAKAKPKFAFGSYSIRTRKRKFRYSDIVTITNNFEKVIGKGGFGIVYHGYVDDTQVAVKMLLSGVQGYQQFQAEIDILLRVYHRNLTTLLGYFTDAKHFGLVYEYMANGDLQSHLLDESSTATNLKWEDRIQIAVDIAQGLEYLHHGCKPPIVHRDVKSANILLNESFQAKLSDFGISKTFPSDSKATHVSTVIAGTPGYLDPEYHKTNRLNEKSDVYSFGVLLMEIITGRPVMSRSHKFSHISEWVTLMLTKGLIGSIIDPRLQENFKLNSAWKVVELAMNCVASSSANRPNMGQVVAELKVCLEMTQVSQEDTERELNEAIRSNFITEHMRIQPLVR